MHLINTWVKCSQLILGYIAEVMEAVFIMEVVCTASTLNYTQLVSSLESLAN